MAAGGRARNRRRGQGTRKETLDERGRSRGMRSAARELREVRRAQRDTHEELARARVPIGTEPAFLFKP